MATQIIAFPVVARHVVDIERERLVSTGISFPC